MDDVVEQGAAPVIRVGGTGMPQGRVTLAGEVDAGVSAELGSVLKDIDESDGGLAEIDMSGVTFMDSATLALLARAAVRARAKPRLLGAPPVVRFLLEVTQLGELFDVALPAGHEPVPSPASGAAHPLRCRCQRCEPGPTG